MLQITDVARDKIKEVMKDHPGKCLRIVTEGYGWGGPQLRMALDESIIENEKYTVNEIDMMIGEDVLPYTEGSQLDFIDDHRGQGFVLEQTGSGSCCGGAEDSDCGDGCCSG